MAVGKYRKISKKWGEVQYRVKVSGRKNVKSVDYSFFLQRIERDATFIRLTFLSVNQTAMQQRYKRSFLAGNSKH